MKMVTELLVDVDEVLGDWQTPCLDIAQAVSGRRVNPADVQHWDILEAMSPEERNAVLEAMKEPGWAYRMKPHEGAQQFIEDLKQLGDVRIVTAQYFPSPTWTYDRTNWLMDFFGIRPDHVTFTHEKHAYQGLMLLDDKPTNIVSWKARHPRGLPILWHIPNTAFFNFDGLRAYSWDQVLTAVEEHLRKVTS